MSGLTPFERFHHFLAKLNKRPTITSLSVGRLLLNRPHNSAAHVCAHVCALILRTVT
jgi:hypothetical protein